MKITISEPVQEIVSDLEQADRMGLPVPEVIREGVKRLQTTKPEGEVSLTIEVN